MKYMHNILVDLTPVLPGGLNGGAKVLILELLQQLIQLKKEYSWTLIISQGVENELKVLKKSNVNFKVIPGEVSKNTKSFFLKLKHKFLKLIPLKNNFNIRDYDLLFCPFTAPHYYNAHIPCVSIIYDLQYKTYPVFFSSHDISHRDKVICDAIKKATKLIAISDYSRDTALEYGKFDSEKIKTIHINLAGRLIHTRSKNLLKKMDLFANEYFLYPANFWKHKNHEMLFIAFQIAKKNGLPSQIKLVLTGAPCERQQYLKNIVNKLQLTDEIIFLDYITNDNLAELMANSLSLVFPSLYEGFGMPIVEAMLLGAPVLCSNVTSLPEIAGDAALYFDPKIPKEIAQTMLSIFQDPPLRHNLIAKGMIQSRKFSDTVKMAQAYLDVFTEALNTSVHDDNLSGVYEDSWVGEGFFVRIKPENGNDSLLIKIKSPEYLTKTKTIKIQKRCEYGEVDEHFVQQVPPNTTQEIRIPIKHLGSKFSVKISDAFKPSELNEASDDHRMLTLQMLECIVIRKNQRNNYLFKN